MFWMAMILVGGILTGSFCLPMKYTTRWKWEHTWAVFSVWTFLLLPWVVGLASVPNLFQVLAQSGGAVLTVFLLGCVWGISSIAFGFGIHLMGLGLGYSLMMGMMIVLGALAPLSAGGFSETSAASAAAMLGGIAAIIVGIALSGRAAVFRDRSAPSPEQAGRPRYVKGLLVCIVAGVTAPMLNLAFVHGEAIRAAAVAEGASSSLAPNAVWAVALLGGFVVNFTYTLSLVHWKGSWRSFIEPAAAVYYFYTLLMGLLWGASIVVYGMAAANLGELGPSAGWAAFNATGILWANCLGLWTGEWKSTTPAGMRIMKGGLVALLAGILLLGLAKQL